MDTFTHFSEKIVHFWNIYIARCRDCLKRWNKEQDAVCPHCELRKIWVEDRYLQIAE